MKFARCLWQRGLAVTGLLVCLGGLAFTTRLAVEGIVTGVVTGRQGIQHFRVDGDFFYYSGVMAYVIASVAWLGLAAFAGLVMVRWKDWT